MTPEKQIECAQLFYESALTDLERCLKDYCDPEMTVENPLPVGVPFGGRYVGHDGLRRYMKELGDSLDMHIGITAMYTDQDRVFVLGHEKSRAIPTGKTYEYDWVHILTISSSGKVLNVREFNDTAALKDAFSS